MEYQSMKRQNKTLQYRCVPPSSTEMRRSIARFQEASLDCTVQPRNGIICADTRTYHIMDLEGVFQYFKIRFSTMLGHPVDTRVTMCYIIRSRGPTETW